MGIDVTWERAVAIIEGFQMPGRLEPLQYKETTYVLDGAHNVGAATMLASEVTKIDAIIFGANDDKDVQGIIHAINKVSKNWIIAQSKFQNALACQYIKEMVERQDVSNQVEIAMDAWSAIESGLRFQKVLVCGSLYLVGEVREHLRHVVID